MKIQSLNGTWTLHQETMRGALSYGDTTGTIPGSVVSFLLEARKIPDPYYRDNELQILPIFEDDYTFIRTFDLNREVLRDDFYEETKDTDGVNQKKDTDGVYQKKDETVSQSALKSEHQILRFKGVDTLAEVYLNDTRLGECYNMHRVYEFDVKGILQEMENVLEVKIKSPTRFIREKDKEYHLGGSYEAMRGFPHIRKAHCMFGWDWGPRIPDEGIFRDVDLLFWNGARIEDVIIHQDHEKGHVLLTVTSNTEAPIQLISPDGKEQWTLEDNVPFDIPSPQLWWPNGLGKQPLYAVKVGEVEKRIGLRTLTIRREKDQWGESFSQEVNGQTFFAMGADYIPEDNVLSRLSKERTAKLIDDCVESHFNSIRVWGGGFYPEDYFFDLCDEKGLVVWQDLMFACANYKTDEDLNWKDIQGENFEANITAEIEENLRRIRHHASLGLISGNNEMEAFAAVGEYEGTEETKAFYHYQNEVLIPKIMEQVAPDVFYWPSSPSSGGNFDEPQDENRGDVHYWAVWHANVPFTDYRNHYFRYLSEFGFQSFPGLETIESFTKPEDRNIFSRVMEMHQRNAGANGKILNYLSQNYKYPGSFEKLVYASQLLQVDAIRYGVEHFRRNRNGDRCMGAIYWQLNDIWPVASWASRDYYGRWKALQYAAKRFFNPVMISCEEESIVSAGRTCISDPSLEKISPKAKLCITNETWKPVAGLMEWEVRDETGKAAYSDLRPVTVEPFSSYWGKEADLEHLMDGFDIHKYHLSYRLVDYSGQVVSSGTTMFCPPKHYDFIEPHLSLEVSDDGRSVTVRADAFAKDVEIYSPEGYVRLSDNFFDLERGTKTVDIMEGFGKKLKARSLFEIR